MPSTKNKYQFTASPESKWESRKVIHPGDNPSTVAKKVSINNASPELKNTLSTEVEAAIKNASEGSIIQLQINNISEKTQGFVEYIKQPDGTWKKANYLNIREPEVLPEVLEFN